MIHWNITNATDTEPSNASTAGWEPSTVFLLCFSRAFAFPVLFFAALLCAIRSIGERHTKVELHAHRVKVVREMRDEAHPRSPEQVAAQRVDCDEGRRGSLAMLSYRMRKVEEKRSAPPSRGPRLIARNIRRFVGPPS
jgi:hypothetical protein